MREPLLGNCHSYARGNALPERPRGRFYARNPMILRVPRRFAVELAEMTNVIERNRWMTEAFVVSIDRLCAGEMEYRPKQHGSVAIRQNETIAVRPDRVLGIESHDAIPDRINQRSQRHWCTGMPGLGLLDRIDRERTNCVDR